MANKFTRFLKDILVGALAPKGNMADFQHASRLYVDDTFRLAPKTKFLYYVVFNINPDAIDSTAFQNQNRFEVNYLVKSADLPKYVLNVEELNQYNRKTRSYTKITYDPVNITFHDDNAGITNSLWALYYGYYFRDRLNSMEPYEDINPSAYQNTAMLSKKVQPFRYGLDNDVGAPFFRSIQLITMSKHRFYSYLLCNPKILNWNHDTVDQTQGNGILENQMSVGYDAVIYNAGTVEAGNPAGFAELHYDTVTSPIGGAGFGIEDIFGSIFASTGFAGQSRSNLTQIKAGLYYENQGNRSPFGYGEPSFINPPQNYYYSTGSSSGFQNYSFGSSNPISGALGAAAGGAVAGIFNGFNWKSDGPGNNVDSGAVTSTADRLAARVAAVQEENNGVAGGQATDAYSVPQPSTGSGNSGFPPVQGFSDESRISSSGDESVSVQSQLLQGSIPSAPEPPPVATNELLNNNPIDVPVAPLE